MAKVVTSIKVEPEELDRLRQRSEAVNKTVSTYLRDLALDDWASVAGGRSQVRGEGVGAARALCRAMAAEMAHVSGTLDDDPDGAMAVATAYKDGAAEVIRQADSLLAAARQMRADQEARG